MRLRLAEDHREERRDVKLEGLTARAPDELLTQDLRPLVSGRPPLATIDPGYVHATSNTPGRGSKNALSRYREPPPILEGMFRRFRAQRLNARGNELANRGWVTEAEAAYRRA